MGIQKTIFFTLIVCGVFLSSWVDAATLTNISVRGNRRVGADAISNQILLKKGDALSSVKVRDSIKNIYKLGFFENIEVHSAEVLGGIELIFLVKEKPAIRKIDYEGYKKIGLSDIKEVVDIKEYAILDLSRIQNAKEKILKLYEQKGFFLAQVKHTIKSDEKTNEVDLVFHIEELDKVKIRTINFIGNQALSDEELKSVMATKEGNLLSWLTKSDNYQEEVLKGDLESLAYFYHTKGYVQVKLHPPLVSISSDKKWIYISVTVEEGDPYQIGALAYEGDLIFKEFQLKENRKIQPNVLFNRELLRQEVLRLADLYKNEGYAFANVNVKSEIREKDKKVDLTFDFEKGQKVYIGKIKITGNSNTRDKVIRREIKIYEGDLYHETKLRESIDRIRALGFFNDVSFTKPQGDRLDTLDILISVTERSTGALTVGAGWSSVDKFVANARISHNNLLGRGQQVALDAQIATGDNSSTRFSASFTEPYTLDTLWSSGFDAYNTETQTESYKELKTGGDLRVGHPLGDFLNTYLTYKLENVRLSDIKQTTGNQITAPGIVSSILNTWIFDKRNNRFEPTKGIYDRLSLEYAGIGGNNNFFKSIINHRFYMPLIFDSVFRINMEGGFLIRTTDKAIPATERFLLGGVSSLRGFEPLSLGPSVEGTNGELVIIGGDRVFFSNFEFEMPLIRQMGVKGVLFYDVGSAFNNVKLGKIRQDVGFGFRWFSPFGPLRVEVGFPIDPQPGEKKQVLQFAITPPF
ncbi:MAG: outer membrane protein assembly factor BamA [Deltaproteobacteria bacterium]|nr:outer membrane protein assembly factor BamA [Deltaproteobacteria bacterium]